MKPERMREKLAEWVGWRRCVEYDFDVYCSLHDQPVYRTTMFELDGDIRDVSELPNYTSELNAMRTLERRLDGDQMFKYYQEIYWLVEGLRSAGPEYPAQHYLLHASAPQRCEALLKTLGLWED